MGEGSDVTTGRRPSSEGFQQVDHTADLALRVWAGTLEGLFRQAALGLSEMLAAPVGAYDAADGLSFEIRGIDLEELLVAWLNEILYRSESGTMLAALERLRVERAGDGFVLRAEGSSRPREVRAGGQAGAAVKAATYHGLKIDPEAPDGYDLIIVFDT